MEKNDGLRCVTQTSRSATFLLEGEGDYWTREPMRLLLEENGKTRAAGETERTVFSLWNLAPDRAYTLHVYRGTEEAYCLPFRTATERVTLDARRFGAKGDGIHEDTAALQAAILSCPAGGRVRIPAGDYLTGPLFLKSHMTLEIQAGATLRLLTEREKIPILPGTTFGEGEEFLLGSWEGNPLDCYAGLITGIGVEDVRIVGQGVLDGQGSVDTWWKNVKEKQGAWRGRMIFLRECRDMTIAGLTVRNSPSWNIHPLMSERLLFCDLHIEAPGNSPNTDGLNPESCRQVRLLGVHFSVGDDCIAIKSGKIYMGTTYHMPCEDIEIAHCAMLDGHGGVTIGSEMSGGVRKVWVHDCVMIGNDRGLRVKTRRGRGKNGVIDGIRFSDVRMERVKSPLVVNAMYFCDPDGRSPWVQSREKQPVDGGTPTIGEITYERVRATDCQSCAAFILGLPERPVRKVTLRDCVFTFAQDAKPLAPAMAEGVEPVCRGGVVAENCEEVVVENVEIEGVMEN